MLALSQTTAPLLFGNNLLKRTQVLSDAVLHFVYILHTFPSLCLRSIPCRGSKMGQDIWFWSFHTFWWQQIYQIYIETRHVCTYARRRHLSLAHDGDPMKWFWAIENSGRPGDLERGVRPESTDADGQQRGGLCRRIVWKHNLGIKLDLAQDQTPISSSRHLADITGNIVTGEVFRVPHLYWFSFFEVTLVFHIESPSSDSILCHAWLYSLQKQQLFRPSLKAISL